MFNDKYKLKRNKYGDVKGIPDGWIELPEGDTERYVDKDIPIYTANVGFTNRGSRSIPCTVNITHMDYREMVQRINEEERIKDDDYASHALSDRKMIVDALRTINNEAKRQRDCMEAAQDKAYGNGKKRGMSKTKDISAKRSYFEARNKKNELYALKDKAIKRMIYEWGINPSGYHVMPSGKKSGYIVVEGYGFHMASKGSEKNLGKCTNKIASVETGCLPVNRAVKAIEAFVAKGSAAPSDMKEAKRTKQHGGNGISRESKGEWFFDCDN